MRHKAPLMLLCSDASNKSDRLSFRATVDVTASAEADKLPTFAMLAYTGGLMNVGWLGAVVVDLAGNERAASVPMLIDHNSGLDGMVGAGAPTVVDGSLFMAGTLAPGTMADRLVLLARAKVPLQASIGVQILARRKLATGEKFTANGKEFTAPDGGATLITKSILREVSFVAAGADHKTAATIAAANVATEWSAGNGNGELSMFEKWLKAKGFDLAALSPEQKASMQAAFDAEQEAVKASAESKEKKAKDAESEDDPASPEKAIRAKAAAEVERIAAVTTAANGNAVILAQAIREGWTVDKTSLAAMRAARPTGPAIHSHGAPDVSGKVIEAALAKNGRLNGVEKVYDAQTLEAAEKSFGREMSIQRLLLECAWKNGYTGRTANNLRDVMRAAFSTVEISGILSNVANKFLLNAFMHVDQAWRQIAKISNVKDFKTNTRYRLTGSLQYELVAPGGEIKHGTLGQDSYTNKAATYGKMLGITFEDIVNDDLDALTQAPSRLGRGAALALNDKFWTIFLNNSTFFHADNSNVSTGAGSAFGFAGLKAALKTFRNQVDNDSKPLGIEPAVLVVPVDLEVAALELTSSMELRDTTATTKAGTKNVFAGKYKVVTSPYLSNAAYTGYSTAAYYLLADPLDLAVMEVAFLNGQETPVVEQSEADFNTLGIQMRGYHHFGCALAEKKAGVRSAGS